VSIIQKRVVVFTNHVFHRHRRRFFNVDPVKRRWGRSIRGVAKSSHRGALNRAAAHRGARSILQRSHDRIRSQKRLMHRKGTILQACHWSRTKIRQEKRAFTDPRGLRSKTSLRQNFQRAHRNSARFLRAPGVKKEKSSSLSPKGKRGFSAGLGKGSKHFSGKVSKRLPGTSTLKGAVKLPF
jgi:hypothetical protein